MKDAFFQLISILSPITALVALFMSVKKNNKGDSVELGRVLEKLDTISADMKEIKADARDTKDEFYAQSVKLAELETRMKNVEKTISNNKKEGDKQ